MFAVLPFLPACFFTLAPTGLKRTFWCVQLDGCYYFFISTSEQDVEGMSLYLNFCNEKIFCVEHVSIYGLYHVIYLDDVSYFCRLGGCRGKW